MRHEHLNAGRRSITGAASLLVTRPAYRGVARAGQHKAVLVYWGEYREENP
ncbi:hypothetical protein ACFQU2_40000 [Siccirubricoccus deserti]|uniref:hypothetical protein n=1 Tax=Siccirubricoccus deserti TaxID=2013562 RepID=UPI001C961D92|nr:hypothetical protein [Siccirubricoccus deserti]